MSKYIYLDFEYNNSQNRLVNLVSVAWTDRTTKEKMWLYHNEDNQDEFTDKILEWYEQDYTFVAFAATAEARCFETMFKKFLEDEFKVYDLKWIDLYLEWRMILNHNAKYTLGKHLINGRVVEVKPKVWRSEEKTYKAENNLGAMTFKLLGEKIDTARKTFVRDIIIADKEVEKYKEEILEYNESDIDFLPQLHDKVLEIYKEEFNKQDYINTTNHFMFKRGDYAARTAHQEAIGYPIDYNSTKSFSDSVPSILFTLQLEILKLFPEIQPFRIDWKKGKASWNQIATKKWIETTPYRNRWRKTDTGSYSLSFDAFADHFSARHDFPKDCFGSQIKRYLTFKRNLNGFLPPKKGASNFWDYVGDDKRVRPFMGIYGSQSSRSQPKATGFMFLKSAWMRSLVAPEQGRACCGIDYGSEEFYLGALMATNTFEGKAEGDKAMIDAYESGDPYTYFGIEAGGIPKGGSKATHPEERDAFKSTTLALQYDMGDESLAAKLTQDTGKKWTKNQASRMSKLFSRVFRTFSLYRSRFTRVAQSNYQLSWDGWCLFPDNPNPRSIGNWPIQTMGAVIMREAVKMAQDRGLDVIFTLHDALYIEYDSNDWKAPKILGECMQQAFQNCLDTDKEIRLDYDIWSPDYEGKEASIKEYMFKHTGIDMQVKGRYIDPRGKKEYENFKQFFKNDLEEI